MASICAVYILANKTNSVLYTGVSGDLEKRIYDHKTGRDKSSFTSRYRVNRLVYYEEYENISDAIMREKQIKAGSRHKKNQLVESINPEWNDLSFDFWGTDSPN